MSVVIGHEAKSNAALLLIASPTEPPAHSHSSESLRLERAWRLAAEAPRRLGSGAGSQH